MGGQGKHACFYTSEYIRTTHDKIKTNKMDLIKQAINKNANHFHILKNDPETSSIFSNNPLVSFRHSKNIRETLVHSNLHQESSPLSGTFPCGVAQCKTCKFIDSSTVISAPKSTYNIQHNFTCTSTHLIYCISCSRCGMLYIGETGRHLGQGSVSIVVQFLPTMLTSLLPDISILVVIAFQT